MATKGNALIGALFCGLVGSLYAGIAGAIYGAIVFFIVGAPYGFIGGAMYGFLFGLMAGSLGERSGWKVSGFCVGWMLFRPLTLLSYFDWFSFYVVVLGMLFATETGFRLQEEIRTRKRGWPLIRELLMSPHYHAFQRGRGRRLLAALFLGSFALFVCAELWFLLHPCA